MQGWRELGTRGASPAVWAECGLSGRCGLMLTLATNLLMWLLAVTNDSMHREVEAELNGLTDNFSGTEETRPPTPASAHPRACAHTLHPLKWVRLG